MLDASGDPRPVFELGLRWLRDNRPAAREPAVVHGDFRNGNLIVGPDGIRAVLDWELAHIGDPLEDLGWLCARAWRWGQRPVVGGMGSRAELLTAYAEAGGGSLTSQQIFWWQLLATVRWGVMCLEQARTHLSGETRSVELAVIGRRACEMEYDVLRMLA
jgi:aminoglycoside phosphotransferase (APT) family kinase protein